MNFKVRYIIRARAWKHSLKCDFHFLINFSIPLYGACIPACIHRRRRKKETPITFIPKAIIRLVNRGKEKFIVLISMAVIALKLWVIRYLFTHKHTHRPHTILFTFQGKFSQNFIIIMTEFIKKATLHYRGRLVMHNHLIHCLISY